MIKKFFFSFFSASYFFYDSFLHLKNDFYFQIVWEKKIKYKKKKKKIKLKN